MNNKKGFTLVELLAVIVILALIMSVAVVSMGNIMRNAQNSTFKETAEQLIAGVQQQLMLNGRLEPGQYFFTKAILDKGGETSPRGGTIQYVAAPSSGKTKLQTSGSAVAVTEIVNGIYKNSGSNVACAKTTYSNVIITQNGTGFNYQICLTAGAGNPHIDGTRADVLNENNTTVIKD